MATVDPEQDGLSRRLDDCLGRIDDRIGKLDLDLALDPDAAVAAVGRHAAELQSLLDGLLADAIPPRAPVDLESLLAQCATHTVRTSGAAIVVRTQKSVGLPLVHGDSATLQPALLRALQVAVAFAGHGGELTLQLTGDEDGVAIAIDAERLAASATASPAATDALVAEWHGRCRVAFEGNRLQLRLLVPASTTAPGAHG